MIRLTPCHEAGFYSLDTGDSLKAFSKENDLSSPALWSKMSRRCQLWGQAAEGRRMWWDQGNGKLPGNHLGFMEATA